MKGNTSSFIHYFCCPWQSAGLHQEAGQSIYFVALSRVTQPTMFEIITSQHVKIWQISQNQKQ